MPEQQSDADPLSAIRARLAKATPTDGPDAKLTRYEHGGGRLFIDGDSRNLIADFYEEADREFYYHARQDIPTLLALYDAALARIAEMERSSVTPTVAAGLMVVLREECERQHARAEQAEARIAALEAAQEQ